MKLVAIVCCMDDENDRLYMAILLGKPYFCALLKSLFATSWLCKTSRGLIFAVTPFEN